MFNIVDYEKTEQGFIIYAPTWNAELLIIYYTNYVQNNTKVR